MIHVEKMLAKPIVLENISSESRPHHKRFRFGSNLSESFTQSKPPKAVSHLTVRFHFAFVPADNYGAVFIFAFLSLWSEVVERPDFPERHTSNSEFRSDTASCGFCV